MNRDYCESDSDFEESDTEDSDHEPSIASIDLNRTSSNANMHALDITLHSPESAPQSSNMYITKCNLVIRHNPCFYCGKMVTKISKHLETVHESEKVVKQFIKVAGCVYAYIWSSVFRGSYPLQYDFWKKCKNTSTYFCTVG